MINDKIEKKKMIAQTMQSVTARKEFGVFGQRLFFRLVEATQIDLRGTSVPFTVEPRFDDSMAVTLPISSILPDGDRVNYTKALRDVKQLMGKVYEVDNDEKVALVPLLARVDYTKGSGVIRVIIWPEVWRELHNLGKGLRHYYVDKAINLSSKYSMTFYTLVSEQKDLIKNGRPLQYSVTEWRRIMDCLDKYPDTNMFIRRVFQPAKEELDRSCPWSFTYTAVRSSKVSRGKPRITSIQVWPYRVPANEPAGIHEEGKFNADTIRTRIGVGAADYLINTCGFSVDEVRANMPKLQAYIDDIGDLEKFLRLKWPYARKEENPKKCLMGALKAEILERSRRKAGLDY